LDSSPAFTRHRNTPEPVWDLRSASALSSGQAVGSGWILSPERVRRFTFSFPVEQLTEPLSRRAPHHILLVEDSAADIGLVREALNEHKVNCSLTAVTDGEQAVKFMDEVDAGGESCPDLIILDLNLPRKPGREVLKRIKMSEKCESVPIIILSSSDNQRDKDGVAAFNPTRYIRKPSKLDDFVKLGAIFKEILSGIE
jgi:two-component system, chemotaxis family, response regulator Rcp1